MSIQIASTVRMDTKQDRERTLAHMFKEVIFLARKFSLAGKYFPGLEVDLLGVSLATLREDEFSLEASLFLERRNDGREIVRIVMSFSRGMPPRGSADKSAVDCFEVFWDVSQRVYYLSQTGSGYATRLAQYDNEIEVATYCNGVGAQRQRRAVGVLSCMIDRIRAANREKGEEQ